MKNKKMVLWIALIVTAIIQVYAQQYDSEKDFQIDWDPDTKNGVIIYKYIGTKKEVNIPPSIQNHPVTRIVSAFEKNKNITKVIIPNGVTGIGNSAFYGCTNLTRVTIPDSITTIGNYAFADCTSLTGVTFEGNIDTIFWDAFSGDLVSKYLASDGGSGIYTRFAGGAVWKGITAIPHYQNGNDAYSKGDFDKAIAGYTQAILALPNFMSAYNNRALAYNEKGEYDKAIADANQAIRLNPNFADPYRHRGYAYMMKGDFTQARTDVNKALQLNPNYQRAKDLDAELRKKGY